jgi:hypothetical protein
MSKGEFRIASLLVLLSIQLSAITILLGVIISKL